MTAELQLALIVAAGSVALGTVLWLIRRSRPPRRAVSEGAAQEILATMADGLLVCGRTGRIEIVNEALCSLTGMERSVLLGSPMETLFSGAGDETFVGKRWRERTVHEELARLHVAGGEAIDVSVSISQLREEDEIRGAVVLVRDIRESRATEERLRALGKAFETTQVGITIADVDGTIRYVNPADASLHGYEVDELIGGNVSLLAPAELRNPLGADELRSLRRRRRETTNLRKDGSRFPVELTSDLLTDAAGRPQGVVTSCLDISERKRLEEELRRRAFYDELTRLPNRSQLMDRLRGALRRAREEGAAFAILCVGLDRLDGVTSGLGPEAADELLRSYAERLTAYALAGDTVARIGGDVFAILLEKLAGLADATRLADRILNDLGHRFQVAGQEVFVGTTVGLVLAGGGSQRGEDLLRDAETAMRRAQRRRGPGSYEVFDEAMHERAVRRLELETDLQRALERRELVLEYQPIVSISGNHIRGAEALIRWRHPRLGMVPPSTLLPLAEETGLILPIGEWALKTACRQNLSWQQAGLGPVFVAVNLSATQFRQRELPAMVRGVLRESGLEAKRLELELTETVLMEDSGHTVDALGALDETGVGLCVDDFGVGYSSLAYLQLFPMRTLKIDQSFVRDLGSGKRAESMISSIIGLAHNLGLKAIAEGVETERQRAVLESQACDEYQGYHYSRPLSGDSFSQLLAA